MKKALAWTLLLAMLSACLFTGMVSAEGTDTAGSTVNSVVLAENFDNQKVWSKLNKSANGYINDAAGAFSYGGFNAETVSFSTDIKQGIQSYSSGAAGPLSINPRSGHTFPTGDFRVSVKLYFDATSAGSNSATTTTFFLGSVLGFNLCNGGAIAVNVPHNGTANGWNYTQKYLPLNTWTTFTVTVCRSAKQAIISYTDASGNIVYVDPVTLPATNAAAAFAQLSFGGSKYVYVDDIVVEDITVSGVGSQQNVELYTQNFNDTTKFDSTASESMKTSAGITIDGVKYYSTASTDTPTTTISANNYHGTSGQSVYAGTNPKTNFYIAPTDKTTLVSDNYTVSMWMYLDQTACTETLGSGYAGTVFYPDPYSGIMVANGGNLRHYNGTAWETTDIWMPKNEWVQITIQYNLTAQTISYGYTNEDGSKTAMSTVYTLTSLDATKPFTGLHFGGGSSYFFYVDDIKIETVTSLTLADIVKTAPAVSTIPEYVAPATITPSVSAADVATVTPIGGWTEGSNTFNVQSDTACVVLVSNDGGTTYTKLTATANANGGYNFTTDMTASTSLTIVPAGDIDGDGTVGDSDISTLTNAFLTGAANALTTILGDSNGDGKITLVDIVYRIAQKNNLVTPEW